MKRPIEFYYGMQENKDWGWKLYLSRRKREHRREQKAELIKLLKMGNKIHDVAVILGIEESEVRELMDSMKASIKKAKRRMVNDRKRVSGTGSEDNQSDSN